MWWYILTFYAGMFFGIFILGLCKAAGDYDRSMESFEKKIITNQATTEENV